MASARAYQYRRHILEALKLSCGCALCGWADHAVALDFHHVERGAKAFTFGDCGKTWVSWARFWAELDKCEVLCARCHRLVEAGVLTL